MVVIMRTTFQAWHERNVCEGRGGGSSRTCSLWRPCQRDIKVSVPSSSWSSTWKSERRRSDSSREFATCSNDWICEFSCTCVLAHVLSLPALLHDWASETCPNIRHALQHALQHAAIPCISMQHTATETWWASESCNDPSTLHRTATRCNVLQRTAEYRNTLKHTETVDKAFKSCNDIWARYFHAKKKNKPTLCRAVL